MSDLRVQAGCDVFLPEKAYSGTKEHVSEVEIIEAVEVSYQESEKRMSAHQRSDTAFSPMFGSHFLQGPLAVALIAVIALFLGHRVVVSIFAVSGSNATQALLAANPNETTAVTGHLRITVTFRILRLRY